MEEGSIKEASLIGPDGPLKCDKIQVSIICVNANTKVPRHSDDAIELIHILEGNEISIGFAVDDWLVKAKYHYFPATFPKVMKVRIHILYDIILKIILKYVRMYIIFLRRLEILSFSCYRRMKIRTLSPLV